MFFLKSMVCLAKPTVNGEPYCDMRVGHTMEKFKPRARATSTSGAPHVHV